ncbi:MAG: hypothetical protein FWG33_04845 [Oscillospiraceae bacterium]|nr:hypothetical protein [Oscillospiraceae bacterium]
MKKLLIGLFILFFAFPLSGCEPVLDRIGKVGFTVSEPDLISEDIINAYDELDKIIASISDNFIVSSKVRIKDIEVWNDLDRYYAENPEILASRGIRGMEISYTTGRGFLDAEVLPQYEMFMKVIIAYETDDVSRLTHEEKQVFIKAEKILKSVSGSTFEKAETIHNYLTENIVYDDNYADNENAFNVYGALIEGLTVCQGYTQSFQMLSHMAGIESLIITGTAGDENHAWNLINMNSGGYNAGNPEWYHIDVTWNDRHEEGNETRSHRYFNVSDRIMSATHSWKNSYYPSASSSKYNYFRYKGIMAASLQNLESMFASLYHEGESFYEVLCTFPVTEDDLDFLYDYIDGDMIMYSIDNYDNSDVLLTIIL